MVIDVASKSENEMAALEKSVQDLAFLAFFGTPNNFLDILK